MAMPSCSLQMVAMTNGTKKFRELSKNHHFTLFTEAPAIGKGHTLAQHDAPWTSFFIFNFTSRAKNSQLKKNKQKWPHCSHRCNQRGLTSKGNKAERLSQTSSLLKQFISYIGTMQPLYLNFLSTSVK